MIRSRVLRRTATFVLVALAAASAIWLTRPHESRLMDRATPHVEASRHFVSETYFWLTTTSILSISATKKPFVVDSNNGKLSILPGFKPEATCVLGLRGNDGSRFNEKAFCSLSPDSLWLICPGAGLSMAYSLDGKRTLEWTTWKVTPQSATIGMPVWLNDDVSIMIPESGSPEDNLYSCDLRKGGQATRIPLSQSIAPEHVGVLPDNSILVSFYPGGPESELGYTDIRIKGNSAELTPGWLELPCLATVSSLVLSPNRQRIAWGLECDRKVAGSGWYRRLMRLIGMRDRTTWEMWTSDYRGKDWRQLGVVEDPRTSTEPYGVQWTPDGRCISFLVKTTLYTVPVD